jgi:hypothetical protein
MAGRVVLNNPSAQVRAKSNPEPNPLRKRNNAPIQLSLSRLWVGR